MSVVLNVFALILGIASGVLSRPKPLEKTHYNAEELKKFSKSVYFFLLTASLTFAAAVCVVVTEELDDFGASNAIDTIVKHTVYWCDKAVSEASKRALYDMDITESELILKVFIIAYSAPIVIMIFIIAYYLMADRNYSIGPRESLLYVPSLLFGFVILSALFSICIEQFVNHSWVWDSVAVSRLQLVELRNYIRINDLAVVGVAAVAVVYATSEYDEDSDKQKLTAKKLKGFVGNVSAETSCFYIDQVANRVLSSALAIALIGVFIYNSDGEGNKLIKVGPMSFGEKAWMTKEELAADKCDRQMVLFAEQIAYNSVWHNTIEAIKNSESKPKPEGLIDSGYLVAGAMAILVSQLALNLISCFSKRAQRFSGRASGVLLALSVPCLFFGAFLFPALYFFAYSFVYPFYQVDFTDKFVAALGLNVSAFLPSLVALAENFLQNFPLQGRKDAMNTDTLGLY